MGQEMNGFDRLDVITDIERLAAVLQIAGTDPGEYRLTVLDRLEDQPDLTLVTLRDGLQAMVDGSAVAEEN